MRQPISGNMPISSSISPKSARTPRDLADWDPATGAATLHGRLDNLGNVQKVEAGFQYREKKDGTDLSEKIEPWIDLPLIPRTSTGEFTFKLEHLTPRRDYEYRARVRHPLITMYGQEKTFHTPR